MGVADGFLVGELEGFPDRSAVVGAVVGLFEGFCEGAAVIAFAFCAKFPFVC